MGRVHARWYGSCYASGQGTWVSKSGTSKFFISFLFPKSSLTSIIILSPKIQLGDRGISARNLEKILKLSITCLHLHYLKLGINGPTWNSLLQNSRPFQSNSHSRVLNSGHTFGGRVFMKIVISSGYIVPARFRGSIYRKVAINQCRDTGEILSAHLIYWFYAQSRI